MNFEDLQFQKYEEQIREFTHSLLSKECEYHDSLKISDRTFKVVGNSKKFKNFIDGSCSHLGIALEPTQRFDYEIILFTERNCHGLAPSEFWHSVFEQKMIHDTDRPQMFVTKDFRVCFLAKLNIIFGLDLKLRRIFYWTENIETLQLSEYHSPLRLNFMWWANSINYQVLHAGCVGTESGAVLFVGPGGQGKSTLSVAAAISKQFKFLGDDSVLASNEEEPLVHSLYSSAKLDDFSLSKFPELYSTLRPELRGDKNFLDLSKSVEVNLASTLPLKALIVPNHGAGKSSTLRPISSAQARLLLVPSTTLYALGIERSSFQFSTQLVRSIPCFTFEYDCSRQAGELLKEKLGQEGVIL